MAKVIIYIPFNQATTPLKTDLEFLIGNTLEMPRNSNFISVQVVFLDQEQIAANQVAHGDTLLVNAHGAPSDTDIGDNDGGNITQTNLFQKMTTLQAAAQAETVIFFCCYSATNGLAQSYKTQHNVQTVYGSEKQCSGGQLFTSTRKSVKSAVWETPAEYLVEMQ
jgi:hypothetical protein